MLKKKHQLQCLAYICDKNDSQLLTMFSTYSDQTALNFSSKIIIPDRFVQTLEQHNYLDRYPMQHVYVVTDIITASAMEMFDVMYRDRGEISIYEIINITPDGNIWFNGFFLPNED